MSGEDCRQIQLLPGPAGYNEMLTEAPCKQAGLEVSETSVRGGLPYKNSLVSPTDMAVEPDMTEGAPTSKCCCQLSHPE